jgi:hypothetical protein
MRCWLVPMRPVTPFMMMPIRCVFIGEVWMERELRFTDAA